MVTLLALVVSGASVASARTLPTAAPVEQVLTQAPPAAPEEVAVEDRLRAAHEEWLAYNEVPRRADLDVIAAEYVAGAPTADWNYQEDVAGIAMVVTGDPGGAFVQIARFDLDQAEEWADRGLVGEIPAEHGVPTGFAMERVGDHVYASLVFDYGDRHLGLVRA